MDQLSPLIPIEQYAFTKTFSLYRREDERTAYDGLVMCDVDLQMRQSGE